MPKPCFPAFLVDIVREAGIALGMKLHIPLLLCFATLTGVAALTSCGSSSSVGPLSLDVQPKDPIGTNHLAAPPKNQVSFVLYTSTDGDKTITQTRAQWSVSDPVNVRISSADDATNGLATCLGPTPNGVFITATITKDGVTYSARSAGLVCF